jgi:hypothetical protein
MLIKNSHHQLFYINSYNRTSGTNSNFSYKLNIDINKNYNKVVVLQASVPKTFYMISSTTNTFILKENSTNTVINVPPGNYDINSFKTVVQALLNTSSPNNWVYTITLPNTNITADTGLYTFAVSGNTSQPSLIFTGTNNNCYENLGFMAGSTNTFNANTLVSVNVINFSLESTLFIHSDICSNRLNDNVLQEIYTTGVDYSSFIKYDCYSPELYAKDFVGKSDTYSFYLTDENGVLINTNGINMNITICIFHENDINEQVDSYIKTQRQIQYLKLKKD